MSGVESIYLYLSAPLTQSILVSSLFARMISSHSGDTMNSGFVLEISVLVKSAINSSSGINIGISLVIVPLTIGIGERRFCAIASAILVLACPIWQSSCFASALEQRHICSIY